ncbi:hypothetical protein SADUNF_Sadunf09G0069100 [Salix dunnii]|uniref:Uncharacterized protein n=1 Tax=Salix dunnii TaxID=1413687 RepID=A0A835MR26_9ROSI|nr:hypothetical protein SADUNF_Sadunf09G0069100 [Salix dunnii]
MEKDGFPLEHKKSKRGKFCSLRVDDETKSPPCKIWSFVQRELKVIGQEEFFCSRRKLTHSLSRQKRSWKNIIFTDDEMGFIYRSADGVPLRPIPLTITKLFKKILE